MFNVQAHYNLKPGSNIQSGPHWLTDLNGRNVSMANKKCFCALIVLYVINQSSCISYYKIMYLKYVNNCQLSTYLYTHIYQEFQKFRSLEKSNGLHIRLKNNKTPLKYFAKSYLLTLHIIFYSPFPPPHSEWSKEQLQKFK